MRKEQIITTNNNQMEEKGMKSRFIHFKKRFIPALSGALMGVMLMSTTCFAAGTSAVTQPLENLKTLIIAVIGAVGSSLVVLFFVIGFCSESIDVKDEMRFESIFRMLIRLGLAEWFVANNVTIMKAFFTSIGNLVGLISAGTTTQLAIDSTQADIIKGLGFGESLVMLVVMESIQNRIVENGKRGKATWLYMDEFHVLLNSEYSAKYLQQLWKKVRKQGGLCTGITQNVVDLLQNYTATTMLANSEFVALLKQANTDSSKMAEVIGVSEAQLRFVTNTASGMGLIKCGSVVIPFDNQISKDTDLYRLYNTNIHEKIAEQKKKEAMLQ